VITWQIGCVLAMAVATLLLLVTNRVRFDAIGLLLMAALVATGILPYDDAVAGLGNKAILTIAGLYVVSEGLTRTGALEFIARALLRASLDRPRRVILLTGAVAALASSFLNNTVRPISWRRPLSTSRPAGATPRRSPRSCCCASR